MTKNHNPSGFGRRLSKKQLLNLISNLSDIDASHYYLCQLSNLKDIKSTTILWANPTALAYTGMTMSEFRRWSFRLFEKIIHPEDLTIPLPWLDRLRANTNEEGIKGLCRIKSHAGTYESFYCHLKVVGYFHDEIPDLFLLTGLPFQLTNHVTRMHIEAQAAEFIESQQARIAELTPRERQIIKLITQGKTDNQISEILNISECTVHTHRNNLLRKTQCPNSIVLAVWATKCGLDI